MRLHDQVARELIFFPDDTFPDRELRSVYWNVRLRDLGRKAEHPGATAVESADRAVVILRVGEPNFRPGFDRDGLVRMGSG